MTDGNGTVTDARGNPGSHRGRRRRPRRTENAIHVPSGPFAADDSEPISVGGRSRHTLLFDYDADYDEAYNADPTNYLHQIVETGMTDTSLLGMPRLRGGHDRVHWVRASVRT